MHKITFRSLLIAILFIVMFLVIASIPDDEGPIPDHHQSCEP